VSSARAGCFSSLRYTYGILICVATLVIPLSASAYRPFDSTDADVVDAREIELELGYFSWSRAASENGYATPQLVFNYGITNRLELVAEFELEHADGEKSQLVDPGIFLKSVLVDGVLQEQQGLSFAIEAGVLLPSAIGAEDKTGFEAIGILSGQVSAVTYHLNLGAGVDRVDHREFAIWGVIMELPVSAKLTLAAEINGESAPDGRAETSALFGLIWRPTVRENIVLDVGIRGGMSSEAADVGITMGLSISF
jgi:hypothetical protein